MALVVQSAAVSYTAGLRKFLIAFDKYCKSDMTLRRQNNVGKMPRGIFEGRLVAYEAP